MIVWIFYFDRYFFKKNLPNFVGGSSVIKRFYIARDREKILTLSISGAMCFRCRDASPTTVTSLFGHLTR